MTQHKVSRRNFIQASTAISATMGTWSFSSFAGETAPVQRIYLAPDAALPMRTAARELAAATGAEVLRQPLPGQLREGEIALAVGKEATAFPKIGALLPGAHEQLEWELVRRFDSKGLLISGSSPRNVYRAAWRWLVDPGLERAPCTVFDFSQRWTMWDGSMNQMFRFAEGFDREKHIREIARTGHTGIEINRYATPGGYFVDHRKFPEDPYPWYLSYAPALDAFVESPLTEGTYPREELQANLTDLLSAAELARRYGLEPGFVCYEPRCVPESTFDRYPELRGSRTDHPGRSLEPRYSLDIANPRVLKHYGQMMTALMEQVPDLRYLVFWTQDSGSGLPFSRRLYFGPNGSYMARAKTLEQMAADFSGTLLDAGRKINPEFEVLMEMGWEYADEERTRITAALPEGVTVSHILGQKLMQQQSPKTFARYVKEDRERGKEPYTAFTVSSMWDDAPIVGVPSPSVVFGRFEEVRKLGLKKLISLGGMLAPNQSPYNINQEIYSRCLSEKLPNREDFLYQVARRWCNDKEKPARQLVAAWQSGDQTLATWPFVKWYDGGAGQTQGRWLTRPLVPDITLLSDEENEPWQRSLFPIPSDIARKNMAFEGGIRLYQDEQLEKAVRVFTEETLPLLSATVGLLDRAIEADSLAVLRDQRDRYQGLFLLGNTVCNLFQAQWSINQLLLKQGDSQKTRQSLDTAIEREIDNAQRWIDFLTQTKTPVFRVSAREETPFLYKTPIADLQVKIAAMQKHRTEEPGPYLKELSEPHSENNLLFY